MAIEIFPLVLVLIASLIAAVAAMFIKKGSARLSRKAFRNLKNWHVIFGGLLYFIGSIFFVIAIKHGELSIIYPIFATQYIWVSLLALLFLKERMNICKWLGVIFIVVGAFLITI